MTETVETFNFLLGSGGVLLLGAAVLLYIDLCVFGGKHFAQPVTRFGLWIAALLSVAAAILALVYSEVFGFLPCGLCWSMRIFIFSQAFMLPVAAYLKDARVALYGIILSVPGVIVGLYQHYLQMGGTELITCPTAAGADCAKRILFEYGFMTFPLLGAVMLLFLIAMYWYILKNK